MINAPKLKHYPEPQTGATPDRLARAVCVPLKTLIFFLLLSSVLYQANTAFAADPNLCYAVADNGRNGGDSLMAIQRTAPFTVFEVDSNLDGTGTSTMEAMTLSLDGETLYAVHEESNGVRARFGTLDVTSTGAPSPTLTGTGDFTPISPAGGIGTGNGDQGSQIFHDIDGLTVDPLSGVFYGVLRTGSVDGSPEDILFQIDPATGVFVPDAFGPGIDYVTIDTFPLLSSPAIYDVDDITVDPTTGQMFGVANTSGGNDRLVQIDKATGAVTDVGRLRLADSTPVNDFEGFSFFNGGSFYGSTGSSDSFYDVAPATGIVTLISTFDKDGFNYGDYEGIACLTGGSNFIGGKVFHDEDADGIFNGSDSGSPGVTVRLYIDENNDGMVDAADTLVQTAVTDGSGDYSMEIAGLGDYVLEIDPGTLPPEASDLSTDNVETANFVTFGNSDSGNDFGWFDTSLIGDTLWYDLDGDGVEDPGEIGIPGVEVSLTPPAGVDIGAGPGFPIFTNTDANGFYQFATAEIGDFVVEVDPNGTTLPAGVTQTGDPDAVCPGAGCDAQTTVNIPFPPPPEGGVIIDTADFGYQPSGVISGTVYDDEDTSGGQNGAEAGLQGIDVGLYYSDGVTPVLDSDGNPQVVVTDSNGDYSFTNLPGDDYVIIVDPNGNTLPSGSANYEDPDGPSPNGDSEAAVTLPDGGSVTGQNFGYDNDLLQKAVDQSTALPGDTLTYTLTPSYPGSGLLLNVQVTDSIPTGTTYVGDSDTPEATSEPAGGGTGTITWDLGSNAGAADGNTAAVPGGVGAFGTADQEIAAPGDVNERQPEITVDASGNLHAVFNNDSEGTWYTTSTDNGTSWSTPVRLPQFFSEDKDRNADIAVDSDGDIHVVVDNENKNVFYTRSTDGGATWLTPVEIDTVAGDNNDRFPRIVVADNDDLHVVFNNDNKSTYYQKSTDGGANWLSAPVLLPQSNFENNDRIADIGVTSNNDIHIVISNEDKNIFYARSTNGGSSFVNQGQIDNTPGDNNDRKPKIVVDNTDSLHVVFNHNDERTWYTTSADNGAIWASPVQLPQLLGEDKDRNADIAVDVCGVLHVVVDNENKNVFYTNSFDNGASWSAGVEIDTVAGDADDELPVIAVTNGTVNVLFDDNGNNVFHNSAALTLCSPATHTEFSAGPTLVTDAATITITQLVSASEAVNTISPITPTVVNATGGAACDSITNVDVGPKSISAGGSTTFSWTCTANNGSDFGSVSFQGSASGTDDRSGLPVSFPTATSNSVLISPPITFQVVIDPLPGVTEITNTGLLQDDNIITNPVPSNEVITTLLQDYGDTPASFGDAAHVISPTLFIGSSLPDDESASQSNDDASGDDDTGSDDDDGVVFRSPSGGPRPEIFADVEVANDTGVNAVVCAWLDRWSGTGSGDGLFLAGDAQDSPGALCQTVPDNAGTPTPFTFVWTGMPSVSGFTYARFRVCSSITECDAPAGRATSGEVEDHRVDFDFTPTVATIGTVDLDALSIIDFLSEIGVAQMDKESLLDLLTVWDPARAATMSDADQNELLIALLDFLDPDLDGQVAVLRWDTLEERGTIGFYVERQTESDAWVRINNDMIPGLVMAPMGGEYMLADPAARPGEIYQYQLIEQEANGNTRHYGPYSVEMP